MLSFGVMLSQFIPSLPYQTHFTQTFTCVPQCLFSQSKALCMNKPHLTVCVCVWESHCNCRLLVSMSNCCIKLAQAVASSMKLQKKFNLLHIHCLHRDHGQDTTRVVEGFKMCMYVRMGQKKSCKFFHNFLKMFSQMHYCLKCWGQ